jgi:hypothetical protein
MKSWLGKLKISLTIDSGRPLALRLRRRVGQSSEVTRFAETSAALHRALQSTRPRPTVPDSLHDSIIRAVRASSNRSGARPAIAFKWVPASITTIVIVLALFWFLHRPAGRSTKDQLAPQGFAEVAGALDAGQQLASAMPSTLVAPLSDEWQRLNHDLDRTGECLLASLP